MKVGYFKVKSTNQYNPSASYRGIFIDMTGILSKVLPETT
jgi:hypothetical protein